MAGCQGKIVRVKWEDKMSERRWGPKNEMARDRIKTKAAELLIQLAHLIRQGVVCRVPKAAAYQLVTRGLSENEGKSDIEAKEDWKRAHKGQSPDELDSVAIGVEALLRRGKLSITKALAGKLVPRVLEPWMMPKKPVNGTVDRWRRVARACR